MQINFGVATIPRFIRFAFDLKFNFTFYSPIVYVNN